MDKVGVGEAQTHLTLWWDARARTVSKKVRDNGGRLSKTEVDVTVLDRIQQGLVNGLAYNDHSEQVYSTANAHLHMSQRPNPAPPPPFAGTTNMRHRRHANMPQPVHGALTGMGGAGRVDRGGYPHHVGNPPMAGDVGGIPPGGFYGGVGGGGGGGGGGDAHNESGWTTTQEVYTVPESGPPSGAVDNVGMMHTGAGMLPQPVLPSGRSNNYVHPYGGGMQQGVPQGIPHGVRHNAPHGVRHNAPHGVPQPHVVPESGPQPVPQAERDSVPQAVPHSLPHAVPRNVQQAVPHGMPHGLPPRTSATPPSVGRGEGGGGRMGHERPAAAAAPPPPPTHRAHHQQNERSNDAARRMSRDAAPMVAKHPIELNCGATEWNPSQSAPRSTADEAIRQFQELVKVPHPPPEVVRVQERFERDRNRAQYTIDIWNWFAAKHSMGSTLLPPAKADAAQSVAGSSVQRRQLSRPADLQRAPPPQTGEKSAAPSNSVALATSERNIDSGDAQPTPAELARRGFSGSRSDQETVREFEVWAKTLGAPRQVVAVQSQFEQGGSRDRYIQHAGYHLRKRENAGFLSVPRSGLQSTRRGGDPATDPVTMRAGDAAEGAPSALPADNQQQAREEKASHAANQMGNKPNPPSPVVKTLKALVGTGPATDNMRKTVLGPSERGLLSPATQPPSSPVVAGMSVAGAVGAVAVVAAAEPVPSPDLKDRAEELAVAEASADSEAGNRASSLTLESIFRKGKKARRRRGEPAVGEAKGGDRLYAASDSSPERSREESSADGFFVDDGDADLADVGTDRELATEGEAGRRENVECQNGEGTTAAQTKTPQEVHAANDTKPAAAVCTTAASASAADSTAALAPHDAVNNTATNAKSASFAAGAAGTSAASSMPSWAHQSAAAVRPSTESVTFSDGRVKPLAAVHPAVAPAAASRLPAAPAPTQATAPLRQGDSAAPSDGHPDRVAPIASIAGAEMLQIFLVRDAPSLADAATALGAERGVQGTGLLRNALRSTGPVAIRLDGRDLGAEDGVIQTVQIAGGAHWQNVVIFDVQALMETRVGNEILSTDLRSILEDVKIRKVMHDVHDHVAALARFFPGPPFRVSTVLDLELVGEALGGDTLNSFGSALWSFDVCDDPYRKFAVDEATFARRPLGADMLLPAAYGVLYLRQSCKAAEEDLVAAGELANVFRASQMKADYAAEAKCKGWRRMTFTDDGPGIDGNPGKKLASYELQKAPELRAKGISSSSREAGTSHDTPPTPETHSSKGAGKEAASGSTPKPRYIPPLSAKKTQDDQNDGVKPPPRRTVTFLLPTDTEAAAAPAAPAWSGECKREEKMEAKITFGNIGNSPPVSSNADSCSFATSTTGGGGKGGGGKVDDSSSDCRGGGDAGGGGDVRGGATRGDDAGIAGSQDSRTAAAPSQEAPPASRDGLESDGESESDASSVYDQDDEDADVLEMLKHLPNIFVLDALSEREMVSGLEEIVLDLGTRPRALVRGIGKVHLCDDEEVLVTRYHINCVVGKFEHGGTIDTDNRTGFDGLLHSVGVMRDKNGTIYGVTIRVRGFVNGVSDAIDDLLFNPVQGVRIPSAPSILVLGGRASGKTTLIRDVCRKLSFYENVLIVDTRNDIGGDAAVPHRKAIGESRRIMVPSNALQDSVMRQGFRNHNPQTLVIDEISSQEDIKACHEMKTRGVRVIAGAVGTIPSILDSPLLGRSLGGLAQDASDSEEEDDSTSTSGTKKDKRAAEPVFDAVIEVEGGRQPMWTVVAAVAKVVDELLANGSVAKPDRRTPLPPDAILQEAETEDCERADGCTGFMFKVNPDKDSKWLW